MTKSIKLNIYEILAIALLTSILYILLKESSFFTGLSAGLTVVLINNILVLFRVSKVGQESTKFVINYFLEMVFIRIPAVFLLLFLSVVILKINFYGIAAGLAAGFILSIYSLSKKRKQLDVTNT